MPRLRQGVEAAVERGSGWGLGLIPMGWEEAWGLDLRQHQGTPGYDRVVGGRLRQHGKQSRPGVLGVAPTDHGGRWGSCGARPGPLGPRSGRSSPARSRSQPSPSRSPCSVVTQTSHAGAGPGLWVRQGQGGEGGQPGR